MDYVKIKCIIYFINQESILSADEGSNAYTDETMNKEKFLISLLDAWVMTFYQTIHVDCISKVHSTQHWLQQMQTCSWIWL